MTLFDSIKPLMRICQFFGLAPFTFDRKTQKWQQNSISIYLSVAFILSNILALFGLLFFNDTLIDHRRKRILILLQIFELAWNYMQAVCVVLELLLKRHQQMKLFNMLETLDILYKHHLNMHIDYSKLKRISRRIVIVWICEILLYVLSDSFYYTQGNNIFVLIFELLFTPPYVISKLCYGYSIILVSLINEYIVVLNVYLKSITKQHGYYIRGNVVHKSKNKRTDGTGVDKTYIHPEMILFMKNVYGRLWEGTIAIKEIMYFSLATRLVNDFIILIINCYWEFLQLFVLTDHWSAILVLSAYILCLLAQIFFVTYNYQTAVNKVSRNFDFKICAITILPPNS